MKIFLFPFFFLFFAGCCFGQLNGQNLVPNPSFEQYDTCPNGASQLNRAVSWFSPTTATPDYYNTCSPIDTANGDTYPVVGVPVNWCGFQNAKTGVGYSGFFAYYDYPGLPYREYVSTKLTSTLQAGTTYYVSFYISLADSCWHATSNIGLYFSPDSIAIDTFINLPYIPQIMNPVSNVLADKASWMLISGQYTAQGNENYITIGNFYDDTNTTAIYLSSGGDTAFGGTSDYNTAYYYLDDVCISSDSNLCSLTVGYEKTTQKKTVEVYPNPVRSKVFIKTQSENEKIIHVIVYNIYAEAIVAFENNSKGDFCSIDLADYPDGIYMLRIQTNQRIILKKVLIQK